MSKTEQTAWAEQANVGIQELGHKPTLPRTLTSRLGIIGTISTVVCPWPSALSIAPLCLSNGGTSGLLVGFVTATIFMALVYHLIAEKLPLAPTAGGQYHMVLKLAPPKYKLFLSYICGFVLCFTWESYLMSAAWLFGMNVSAMVTIYSGVYSTYYSFVPTVCMLIIACIVNLTWGRHMNVLEALVLVVQFSAFFLVLVVLAMASGTGTLAPSFTFETTTGYPRCIGAMLGFCYCVGVLGGFDCATHLAEDTENPSTEIPKSLLLSTTVNSFTCIIIAILVTFCAGDANIFTGDLALSGHPLGSIIQLFFDAGRGNKSAACAVFGLSAVIFGVCTINTTTTSSRMLFSLVRDGRDPTLLKFMARDFEGVGLPVRCIVIADIIPLLILWINFVSAVGFQAIVSKVTMALVISYFLVFACALDARIYRSELLGVKYTGFWHPGRSLGIILDVTAMIFLFVVGLLCCLPFAPDPNAAGWNYAPFMILGVAMLGLVFWFASARKYYRPGNASTVTSS